MAKSTKGTDKAAKLADNVAGLKMTRDGNDLVVRFTGLYASRGIPTSTGKDTRKLASSPGMFYWVQDGSSLAHQNGENRRLGLKVTAILGAPRDSEGVTKGAKAKADAKVMSAVSFE